MQFHSRSSALKKLKKGDLHALVCTDVGARGIDIDDCDLVINYDLAPLSANHIHRSGRTARAGNGGKCITMLTKVKDEKFDDFSKFFFLKSGNSNSSEWKTIRSYDASNWTKMDETNLD